MSFLIVYCVLYFKFLFLFDFIILYFLILFSIFILFFGFSVLFLIFDGGVCWFSVFSRLVV